MDDFLQESVGGNAQRRNALQQRLVSEFHITTLFIPVKTVALVLGMSPSTLYSYIRNGVFFLPFRLINKTPMVAVDDFVDWYCTPSAKQAARCNSPSCKDRATVVDELTVQEESGVDEAKVRPAPVKDRDSARLIDLAIQETLNELGLTQASTKAKRK